MVAAALEVVKLHKRIALRVLLLFGTKPPQLLLGFMAATSFISMWMSNTATAAMMMPIAEAVLKTLHTGRTLTRRLAVATRCQSYKPLRRLSAHVTRFRFSLCGLRYAADFAALIFRGVTCCIPLRIPRRSNQGVRRRCRRTAHSRAALLAPWQSDGRFLFCPPLAALVIAASRSPRQQYITRHENRIVLAGTLYCVRIQHWRARYAHWDGAQPGVGGRRAIPLSRLSGTGIRFMDGFCDAPGRRDDPFCLVRYAL